MVPLQLVTVAENGTVSKILWVNDKPSISQIRPISIKFAKETTVLITREQKNLEEQIANIQTHNLYNLSVNINICYEFLSTMFDVKSINAITDTNYTKRCYICGFKDKDLSDVDKTLITPINDYNLKYGISSLHAWIRCFERLVNLSLIFIFNIYLYLINYLFANLEYLKLMVQRIWLRITNYIFRIHSKIQCM